MSLADMEMIFKFIGGLGMFLYGMNVMADGLQKSAGSKIKKWMEILTSNRLMAVLVGALITGVIQSSSATTVMVVGFVNAGLMTLTQAVGVIMGANIGTTVTAWIVSMSEWGSIFKPEFFAPFLIGIGVFLIMFSKSSKKKSIGEILVGFGILFVGLSFMSDSITPYKDSKIFSDAFSVLGNSPILGILTGTIVTGIIQSSSASVGILQTLAANGIVTWNSAIFITLGQNIGTCVTALISSAGANRTAKRAAVIHLLFNVIGAVIFGTVMYIIFIFYPNWASSSISQVEISIFHTVFNVANTIILFPFAEGLVKLSGVLLKDKPEEMDEFQKIHLQLDERMLETPAIAVSSAKREVAHMGKIVLKNVEDAAKALQENSEIYVQEVLKREKRVNQFQVILTEFLVRVDSLSLNEKEYEETKNLMYTISDFERISDHCENLAELAQIKSEREIHFSTTANENLQEISNSVISAVRYCVLALEQRRIEDAYETGYLEVQIDGMEERFREDHIKRLNREECQIESGIIFIDALSNLERIADHAYNIAGYVAKEQGVKI